MALIDWDESFSVGYADIDEQHKQLIAMVNDLDAAMTDGRERTEVGRIIAGMIEYAQIHFQTEEEYFIKYAYAGKNAHIVAHKDFILKAFEFSDKFEQGAETLPHDVITFLSRWVCDHIRGLDAQYKGHFED